MRIAAVQTRPVAGDLPANTAAHLRLIELAADAGAGLVLFPELSLTGYEPTLAADLAVDPDDPRLDVFAAASARRGVTICLGAPTRGPAGVRTSTILFRPDGTRRLWSKHHLHADETQFFAPGPTGPNLIDPEGRVALAICYEITVPAHARAARESGATTYLASVAKTSAGIEAAHTRLREIAREHTLTVVMANCAGVCDGARCGGRSAAWDAAGRRLGQLDDAAEGVLVLDTGARAVFLR